jgi:hypothetical protein
MASPQARLYWGQNPARVLLTPTTLIMLEHVEKKESLHNIFIIIIEVVVVVL